MIALSHRAHGGTVSDNSMSVYRSIPLHQALPLSWVAGLFAALGPELLGLTLTTGRPDNGTFAMFTDIAVALGLGLLSSAAALGLLRWGLGRLAPGPLYSIRTCVLTLAIGSAAVLALSPLITPGGQRPTAGSLTMLLLAVPYPLAYLLLTARRRVPMLVTAAVAVALAGLAVPMRDAQVRLVASSWLDGHRGIDRTMLRTVTWPSSQADHSITSGDFGTRTVVRLNRQMDLDLGAIVAVAPVGTDPCAALPELVTNDLLTRRTAPVGSVTAVKPMNCTPSGPDAWRISDGNWTGYAVRRDGVLLTLSFDSPGDEPNLPAIARTLHPMSDTELWTHLQSDSGVLLLLL